MSDQTKSIEVNAEETLPQEQTERIRDRRIFVPRTDIFETKDDLVLLMDVPGVSEENVEIMLEKNVLTIRAYPAFERPAGLTLAYAEFSEGDFQRSFALSDEIDREKIQASVKNGVLSLRLGKAGQVKPQKIMVKAG